MWSDLLDSHSREWYIYDSNFDIPNKGIYGIDRCSWVVTSVSILHLPRNGRLDIIDHISISWNTCDSCKVCGETRWHLDSPLNIYDIYLVTWLLNFSSIYIISIKIFWLIRFCFIKLSLECFSLWIGIKH